jgi:ribosomal protein S10
MDAKLCATAYTEIISRAKQQGYETRGGVRITTKVLTVTTRHLPCVNGANNYDCYEMRIHKRVIDIYCPSSNVK